MIYAISITIVFRGSGTGNKASWVVGNASFISLVATTFIPFIVFLCFSFKLTTLWTIGIQKANHRGDWRIRNRLLQGLLLHYFFRHGLLRLGLLLLLNRSRFHMGKGRGNNGWTHLTLHRVVVITLQSTLDPIAILVGTKVRKE